jgi:hypothetical protein
MLALGQTVFWDEPLKAMLPLIGAQVGVRVDLVAGIHDTDYFAKLPGGVASQSQFSALPKNDGTTKNFWSAAGEFSALFGSEATVPREAFGRAGVPIEKLSQREPAFIDHITEAYGWRGIAARDPRAQVTSELSLEPIFPVLQQTFHWALNETVKTVATDNVRNSAIAGGDSIHTLMCDTRESCMGQTLATFYECLLSDFHKLVAGKNVASEITRTSTLLSFSERTCNQKRFQFVDLFINPSTRTVAIDAYNRAVEGSDTYSLDKFGTGAIPFDLVIPGVGRGTIRLAPHALVIMTPEPIFVDLKSEIRSISDLAKVVEARFGPCAMVGKAITLISMLASEFIFAFHETASSYVHRTRAMHNHLIKNGIDVRVNPILRVSLSAWDSLSVVDASLSLPGHLQQGFGAQQVSCGEFAGRWRQVVSEQERILERLHDARSPHAAICALTCIAGDEFRDLAAEYEKLHERFVPLRDQQMELDKKREKIRARLRAIKREWQETEIKMGQMYRAGNMQERQNCMEAVSRLRTERRDLKAVLIRLGVEKANLSADPVYASTRTRRKQIEQIANELRMKVVRNAYLTVYGLRRTNCRPSAWWFPVLSPSGAWFKTLMETAKMRIEPLVGESE